MTDEKFRYKMTNVNHYHVTEDQYIEKFMKYLDAIDVNDESVLSGLSKRDLLTAFQKRSSSDDNVNIKFNSEPSQKDQFNQTTYWADRLLIDLESESDIFRYLTNCLFPTIDIFVEIPESETAVNILNSLYSLNVNFAPHSLPPLSSVMVPSLESDLPESIINAGTYIKRMSWAPLNPELHRDQFLAVCVYKEFKERISFVENSNRDSHMIQIYNCGPLIIDTKKNCAPELEMVLIHNWGKVTDISWSPKSLPAVSRTPQLIGHLALCCIDGFTRIVPICQLRGSGRLVSFTEAQSVLCLGSIDIDQLKKQKRTAVFPTTLHWRREFCDRIIVGYNTGHVGMFVLQASVLSGSQSTIIQNDVCLKPSFFVKVFDGPCCSVQISPRDWHVVTCSSFLLPNAVIIDLNQQSDSKLLGRVNIDQSIGSRIIWPLPGDVIVFSVHKPVPSASGFVLCSAQNPSEILMKFSLNDISSIDTCHSFSRLSMGTRSGQLHTVLLYSNDINDDCGRFCSHNNEFSSTKTKINPIKEYSLELLSSIDSERRKTSDSSVPSVCNCSQSLQCVHRLRSRFSISISKEFHNHGRNDTQTRSMLNIHEIASNPNVPCSQWIAVALECGLIHLLPLVDPQSNFNDSTSRSSNVVLSPTPLPKVLKNENEEEGICEIVSCNDFQQDRPFPISHSSSTRRPRETVEGKMVISSCSSSDEVICKPCFVYLEPFPREENRPIIVKNLYGKRKRQRRSKSRKKFSSSSSSPSFSLLYSEDDISDREMNSSRLVLSSISKPDVSVDHQKHFADVGDHSIEKESEKRRLRNQKDDCRRRKDQLEIDFDYSIDLSNIRKRKSIKHKQIIDNSQEKKKRKIETKSDTDQFEIIDNGKGMVTVGKVFDCVGENDYEKLTGESRKISIQTNEMDNTCFKSINNEQKRIDRTSELKKLRTGSASTSGTTLDDFSFNISQHKKKSLSLSIIQNDSELSIINKRKKPKRINIDSLENSFATDNRAQKTDIDSEIEVSVFYSNPIVQNPKGDGNSLKKQIGLISPIKNSIFLTESNSENITKTNNKPRDSKSMGKSNSVTNSTVAGNQKVTESCSGNSNSYTSQSAGFFSIKETDYENDSKKPPVSPSTFEPLIGTEQRAPTFDSSNHSSKSIRSRSTSKSSSKPSWWGTDYFTSKENDSDLDIHHIDDISFRTTSIIVSPLKRVSSHVSDEARMNMIKKVITQGISQSGFDVNAANNPNHDSPQLLQPFRPLKSSKSLNCSQSNDSL